MSTFQTELGAKRSNKRFFTAVKVDLEGRFMRASGVEARCRVVEMSTAGMTLASPANPPRGEKIIVYTGELGRFEGVVENSELDSFSIALKLTELKHKKLSEQLVWYTNRDALDLPEGRRHKRIVPMMQRVVLKLASGAEKIVKITDVSLTSVNIEAHIPTVEGQFVTLGQKAATVTRVFEGGFVADFSEPFDESGFDETIRL